MNYQCKICTNLLGNEIFIIREMMYGTRENFTYLRCSSCGCLQIIEPVKEIFKYYPNEKYYSFQFIKTDYIRKSLKNLIKYCLFNAFLHHICIFLLKKIPYIKIYENLGWLNWLKLLRLFKKNSAILDVGCGNGVLLQEMSIWGFNNLTGIDPYIEKDFFYSPRLKIYKQDIFNHIGMYDLIMLHHSFEHMDNPHLVLKQLHKMLNPKGFLLIRIPLSDSFAWRKYSTNWFQIDAPRHLFLHTKRSITLLCKNTGLILKQIVYDSTEAQFLQSEKYCRDITLLENFIFSSKYIKKTKEYARCLNELMDGDQACFIFQNEK